MFALGTVRATVAIGTFLSSRTPDYATYYDKCHNSKDYNCNNGLPHIYMLLELISAKIMFLFEIGNPWT